MHPAHIRMLIDWYITAHKSSTQFRLICVQAARGEPEQWLRMAASKTVCVTKLLCNVKQYCAMHTETVALHTWIQSIRWMFCALYTLNYLLSEIKSSDNEKSNFQWTSTFRIKNTKICFWN
jgi:hypothetical protein